MSIEFRRRDEHSFWSNSDTIRDLHEALSLLLTDGDAREPTHLRRSLVGIVYQWEIIVPWYREGSSGADSWGTNYYDVSDELAGRLRKEGFVEPHVMKGWGWSKPDPERLVITHDATESLYVYENGLRVGARSLLKPGIHTDLSGEPKERGSGREHGRYGRFYASFETPQGDTVRVYPEQQEIVYPYPPPAQAEAA